MKKILISAALVLVSASSAFADCAANLGINFTPNQRIALCKEFGSAIDHSLIPAADNTYDLGSASKEWRNLYLGTNLIFSAASAKIVPGATSLLFRNNADNATNIAISDAGGLAVRGNITLTGTTLTQGLGTSGAAFLQGWANDWRTTSAGGTVLGTYQANSSTGSVLIGATTNHGIDLYANNARVWNVQTDGDLETDATGGGNVILSRTGKTLAVDSGTAASACAGSVTATGTTAVTVATTCAATGARIFTNRTSAIAAGVTEPGCWVTNIVNGVSFDFDCNDAAEDSTFAWWILKEG